MRDLRDPQKLGEAMLEHMKSHPGSRMTDEWPAGHALPIVSNYPQDESTVTSTVRQYRKELEERAAQGDRYAISMLMGVAYEEPSDSA